MFAKAWTFLFRGQLVHNLKILKQQSTFIIASKTFFSLKKI